MPSQYLASYRLEIVKSRIFCLSKTKILLITKVGIMLIAKAMVISHTELGFFGNIFNIIDLSKILTYIGFEKTCSSQKTLNVTTKLM